MASLIRYDILRIEVKVIVSLLIDYHRRDKTISLLKAIPLKQFSEIALHKSSTTTTMTNAMSGERRYAVLTFWSRQVRRISLSSCSRQSPNKGQNKGHDKCGKL